MLTKNRIIRIPKKHLDWVDKICASYHISSSAFFTLLVDRAQSLAEEKKLHSILKIIVGGRDER